MRHTLLTAVLAAAVSAAVTTALTGIDRPAAVSAQEERIRAQEFLLVGSGGANLARLFEGTDPQSGSSGAVFRLFQEGRPRATLAYGQRSPEAGGLFLNDRDGKPRIALALATGPEQGSVGDLTRIGVLDRNGRVRIALGVDRDGSPFLVLLDSAGSVTWNVGAPTRNVLGSSP
ncbi:MAG: hypothetical protein HYY05_07235 [Chloroflexi bacterium]|nr:hypothetical protein [Chloroflexota bacterium]